MRKVKTIRTHTPIHIPSIGDLGVLFPTKSKTLEGLDMELDDQGMVLKFLYAGKPFNIFIPHSNVVAAELELLEIKVKK